MSEQLPAPLVPSEVDLRDFSFMPLTIAQLKQSKQWLRCKRRPELAFYSLNLWMSAWHERPAGSLEDDDDVLADRAMCPPEKWDKIRGEVLRNWVKCDDGRLYHPVVAEKALEAWNGKVAHRNRMEEARRAKEEKRKQRLADQSQGDGASRPAPRAGTVTERPAAQDRSAIGPATGLKGKGQGQGKGKGQGQGDSKNGGGGGARERGQDGNGLTPTTDAERVMAHFLAERSRLWPDTSRLPGPRMTIRTEAQQFLDRSAPAELLCEIITRGMEATAAAGKQPPSTLKAYQDSLADGVASYVQRMPEGKPDPFGVGLERPKTRREALWDEQMAVLERRAREEEAAAAANGGQS